MNNISKQDILDWLQYHEEAWRDMLEYFNVHVDVNLIEDEEPLSDLEYDEASKIPTEAILAWIDEHSQLAQDFESFFEE